MSQHTTLRLTFAVLIVAGAGPAHAFAQSSSTTVGVYGGLYSPLGSDPRLSTVGTQVDRNNSFVGGARLNYWGPGVLGLELEGGLTPAKVDVAGAPINRSRNQDILTVALRLMAGVSPAVSPLGFHLGVGPAFIRRNSDAFQQSGSLSRFGIVAGGGFRFPIASRLHLRFDAEDYIYGGKLGSDSKTWNDLVLSAGLGVQLGGRTSGYDR
ncbi:MAG TPA: outer membrane beta-barrel protein [Gemmatimonadales bacterium]|nr:outer membrane beta-barrel protein [Gemmatimonadales bacterium]